MSWWHTEHPSHNQNYRVPKNCFYIYNALAMLKGWNEPKKENPYPLLDKRAKILNTQNENMTKDYQKQLKLIPPVELYFQRTLIHPKALILL